jgi:hypothetical protein
MPRKQLALAIVAILLLAATLRLWSLPTLPGGLHFDLGANLFDAVEVLDGAHPIYFPRNNGREPLVIYMESLAGLALGVTPFSARLVTVAFGMLGVAATGFAGRQVARLIWPTNRARADTLALVAAGLMAGLFWAVFFSRFGLRTGIVPTELALAFGLMLRGIRRGGTRAGWASYLAAGLCLGLALDTHTAPRLAPPAIALPLLVAFVLERRAVWLARLCVLALGAAIAFAPLGLHYLRHPADFGQHSYDNYVLNPAVPGGGTIWSLLGAVGATASAFVWQGSPGGAENLPGRPIFDPIAAVALLVGIALALGWLRQPRGRQLAAVTLLGWLVVLSLPSALSLPAPAYGRITGAIAPAVLLAAIGLVALAERLLPRHATALLIAAVGLSAAWTARDYFGPWAQDYAYAFAQTDKADAAEWLASRPPEDRVFLAPLWATDFGVEFTARRHPYESFSGGLVIPTAARGETIYAYPYEDATGPAEVSARLTGNPPAEVIRDPSGEHALLRVVRLPPGRVPPPTNPQRLEDGVAFAGRSAQRQGNKLVVELRWYATATPSRDYTVFVQLRDGGTRAQHDAQPLGGSFPTTRWHPGDLVLDRHELILPPDLPASAHLYAGMYDTSGRRLHLIDERGQVAPLDEMDLGPP